MGLFPVMHAAIQQLLETDSVAVMRQLGPDSQPQAQASMPPMGHALEGTWRLDPRDIKLCMRDGRPTVLGSGGFGKVRCACAHMPLACAASHP